MLGVLVLLLLAIGVQDCRADCNICSASSNAACVSETQFMFCEDNLPIQPINSCPSGTYCTAQAAICQADSNMRSCNSCSMCNSGMTHACLGVRTFALCLGTLTPSSITGSCAPNYVCNLENPNICSSATSGSQATCPLVDDELSTTMSPGSFVDPTTYCSYIQQAGRFPYGNTLETTCKEYINCYLSSSSWYGALYYCPGSTYFQPTSKMCNTTIPPTCTSGVRNLQLRSLRLS
ncbi:uncharacterized protein LOC135430556 [Drosophila montana]|uniref:uncharacterized protein LOC135430556 n=1 Tax=Drosophila montana TaxID=40370 RepID=UPI00313BA40A